VGKRTKRPAVSREAITVTKLSRLAINAGWRRVTNAGALVLTALRGRATHTISRGVRDWSAPIA